MSSSLLLLTCISRKIDERQRYRRQRGRRKKRRQERERKIKKKSATRVPEWGAMLKNGLHRGTCLHYDPLRAEAAMGSHKMRPKMVDDVRIINLKIMLIMCRHSKCINYFNPLQQPYEIWTHFQMRKLRQKEDKKLAQGHATRKWQSQNSDAGMAPGFHAVSSMPCSFTSTLELAMLVLPQHTSHRRGSAFILKTLPLVSPWVTPVPVMHSFDASVVVNR